MDQALSIVMTFPHSLGTPGGGTVHCTQLAAHFKKAGARVRLLPVQSGGIGQARRRALQAEDLARAVQAQARLGSAGIQVDPVPASPLHFALDGLALRRRLRGILEREQVDVVIGWHHEALSLASLARQHGIILAMMAAGSYGHLRKRTLRKLSLKCVLRHNFRRAQILFTSSEFSRRQVRNVFGLPGKHIATVHLGVDPAYFQARREFRPGPPAKLFFLGQISVPKGFFDLLEALRSVRDRGQADWELYAAGWGDIRGGRSRAEALGLGSQVHFLGYLEADIIVRHLEESLFAVMPSFTESFGLAVAECQAAGLPVIAYSAGGVPELIRDGETGWLVPVRDIAALAQAIQSALRDAGMTHRMGLAARARMQQGYTWENTTAAMLQQLGELVKRNSKKGQAP